MPGPDERMEIWRRAVPSQLEVADDIDWADVARRFD
jgi:hypothetical protein